MNVCTHKIGTLGKPFKLYADVLLRITVIYMIGCLLFHWSTSLIRNHSLLTVLCYSWRNLKIRMTHGGEPLDLTQNLSEKGFLQSTGIYNTNYIYCKELPRSQTSLFLSPSLGSFSFVCGQNLKRLRGKQVKEVMRAIYLKNMHGAK